MRIVVAFVVALCGTAYAQAPGEYVAAPAVGPGYHDVMADRWSVGFGIGSVGLHAPDASPSSYAIGEFAFRFRLAPHFELETTLGGGNQSDNNGATSVGLATLGARYIFQPRADWNVWIVGAIGALSVRSDPNDASTQVDRGMAEAGMGIERRFAHFALQAEFRAIAAGAPKQTDASARTDAMQPAASDTLAGAELSVGASWYF
jgi:hypothetical protein